MKNDYLYGIGILLVFLVVSMPFCFAAEMSLTYDANGNLITGDGKYRTYNSLNQLSKVYNGSTNTTLLEEYTYHPVEERVVLKKSYNMSGSLIETTYYINQNYMQVINSNGSVSNYTYYYLQGQLVAQDVNGVKTYQHTDIKGDVVAVTNSSGSVIERTSYDPYGEVLSGGQKSRFNYEGKEQDKGIGSIPSSGLISYWSFNDGTSDEVTGNNGVIVNATRASGFVRDAYRFDGSADYVLVNDSNSLDISSNITISAWIYPVKTTQGYIVCKYGDYMLQWYNSTIQGGVWNNSNWYALTTSGSVPLNTWTHITFTYNKSNAYIYINGALNASGTNTIPADINTNPFVIGAKSATDRTRDFNGTVDEVGVWNRAISSSEARTLYEYGRYYDTNPSTDFNARMMMSGLGFFAQPDSLIANVYDPQSLNRYMFERGNPYRYKDPTGHNLKETWDTTKAIVAAFFITYVASATQTQKLVSGNGRGLDDETGATDLPEYAQVLDNSANLAQDKTTQSNADSYLESGTIVAPNGQEVSYEHGILYGATKVPKDKLTNYAVSYKLPESKSYTTMNSASYTPPKQDTTSTQTTENTFLQTYFSDWAHTINTAHGCTSTWDSQRGGYDYIC